MAVRLPDSAYVRRPPWPLQSALRGIPKLIRTSSPRRRPLRVELHDQEQRGFALARFPALSDGDPGTLR